MNPEPRSEANEGFSDCGQALATLYRFLDGALDEKRRTDIASHLDGCGHCHEMYSFEAEVRAMVARGATEEVPEGLRERIAARLRELDA
ncbi:MAG: mycothiol system anti-sigma-R factor [Actinobacteria bacterium]|nr:mycothiol system anti-sigma-R factor [Actinomycetota bacterium]